MLPSKREAALYARDSLAASPPLAANLSFGSTCRHVCMRAFRACFQIRIARSSSSVNSVPSARSLRFDQDNFVGPGHCICQGPGADQGSRLGQSACPGVCVCVCVCVCVRVCVCPAKCCPCIVSSINPSVPYAGSACLYGFIWVPRSQHIVSHTDNPPI